MLHVGVVDSGELTNGLLTQEVGGNTSTANNDAREKIEQRETCRREVSTDVQHVEFNVL